MPSSPASARSRSLTITPTRASSKTPAGSRWTHTGARGPRRARHGPTGTGTRGASGAAGTPVAGKANASTGWAVTYGTPATTGTAVTTGSAAPAAGTGVAKTNGSSAGAACGIGTGTAC